MLRSWAVHPRHASRRLFAGIICRTAGKIWQPSRKIFSLQMVEGRLAPMPGLFELLEALEKAGIPKAVCTSSRRRVLKKLLGTFHLEPRFAFTLTAEDVTRGKPDPEIYLKAAARFGVLPQQTMVLEDSPAGCTAGHAAGAFVVAVPNPNSREMDFSCGGPSGLLAGGHRRSIGF